MIADLIKRLRAFVDCEGGDIADVEEAAAELERLRSALLDCARKAEALKRDCTTDPECPQAVRNAQYQAISTAAHIALGTLTGPSAPAAQPVPQPVTEAASLALAEVEKATRKFPTWPTDPLHALGVLGEEFGELTKDVLQMAYEPNKTNAGNVRKEAIQTAAMALRFLASLDRYEYRAGEQHSQVERAHGIGGQS